MSDKLEDIIKAVYPYKNIISVTTNGTLLSKSRARELKKTGVDIFTISLDSFLEEEHDSFRGEKGTYQKTMEGIENALSAGCHVTIGTVLSHQNIRSPHIEDLFSWASKRKIIVCTALAVPAGRWSDNSEILLTQEDMSYLQSLHKKYPYLRTDFDANYWHKGCGAVKEILYLTPQGDVLPCPYIHISLGNIFEEPLSKIRDRALKIPYFKYYSHTCLCATDKEFIEKYILPLSNERELPVSWKKFFS